MENFIIKLIANAVAVFIAAKLLNGVEIKNFLSALVAALLIGLMNATIKPIFIFLTIPLTIVTLGLFILVIDAIILLLVDRILSGFKIKNFGWALLFSLVLALINSFLVWLM